MAVAPRLLVQRINCRRDRKNCEEIYHEGENILNHSGHSNFANQKGGYRWRAVLLRCGGGKGRSIAKFFRFRVAALFFLNIFFTRLGGVWGFEGLVFFWFFG